MRNFVSAFAVVAAVAATPAFAQDDVPVFNGPYAGLVAGYDHVTVEAQGAGKDSKDGFVFGALAGYDIDMGGSVAGVEAEITGATTKQSANNLLTLGDTASLKAGRDLYAGVRVGIKAAPNLLIYAKGGYTNARVTLTYNDNAGFTFKEGDNLDGYRLGAGVQYQMGRLGLRAEYRYSDYGEYSYNGFATGLEARRQQVVVAVTSKF